MNASPDAVFWLRALGMPALQAVVILALVALLAPRLRSARAQRAAWLAGFGAVALALAGSLAGMDRQVAGWLEPRPRTERAFRVQTNLPVSAPATTPFTDTVLLASPGSDPSRSVSQASETTGSPLWWPAWLWLAGIGVVAGRKLVLQGMFAWWWRRHQAPAAHSIRDEVRQVAHRLGMRGQVRVIEFPGLLAPIAFGALRPTIGLPSGFATAHGTREREAMLAHELAHLTARDPVWLAVADAICAALWWVPPVWWAHRRLRAACEAAADEASLVVEDGPTVLADCLVTLAARLPRQGAFGILGMAVFRSELGRRVERLLALRARGLVPSSGRRLLLMAALAAVSAAALGLVSSAWALPRPDTGQPTLLALAQAALALSPQQAGLPVVAASVPSVETNPATPTLALPADNQSGEVAVESGDWLVLDVQFAEPLESDRAALTRVCMDALTRRLYAVGEFSRVNCEPSAQGISVRLRFREDSKLLGEGARRLPGQAVPPDSPPWSGFVGGLKPLVEHRGQLEFRAVHPESERLLQANQCPEEYEVLAASAIQGDAARRYVVKRGAAAGLTEQQIQAARAVPDPVSSDWRISVEFTEAGATRFAELTRSAVGQVIALVMDGEVLTAPMIRSPILGGRCEISGRLSEGDASLMATLLQHPLPARLQLSGLVQPINAVPRPDSAGGPVYAVNAVGYVSFAPVAPTNATTTANPAGLPPAPDQGGETAAAPPVDTGAGAVAVATLVQDARLLYELGKWEEAGNKIEQALRQEPENRFAKYYQAQIREAEFRARRQAGQPSEASVREPPPPTTSSTPPALFTRTFRVDPNTITQSIETVLGKDAKNLSATEALRRVFDSLGVNLGGSLAAGTANTSAGLNAFQGPAGRALFYNDRTGVMLVRATLQDLDTVETVLQMLNDTPPQVMIEVKFVEITQEDTKALGFDWFLGGVPMGGATNTDLPAVGGATTGGVFPGAGVPSADPASPPATGRVATITELLSDPQFRSVVTALNAAGTNAQATQELRGDQLDWPGRSATNAANIRIQAALGARLTGILTDPQYRVVLRALEQRAGVDVLAAPRVTTLSGRQAQVQIADLMTVITAVNPAALVQPGAAPGTNAVPYLTSTIAVGPTLDVIPSVSADGFTISLTVIPTVTEFLGYDSPGEDGKVRIWEDGTPKPVALPLPRFRVRQMVTQARVYDGQTLVLGGYPVEATRLTKDKVPGLGDLPGVGSLFRRESKQVVKKNLLVFVTVTIVDPAGNPVHAADQRPYDPNTVPIAPSVRLETR